MQGKLICSQKQQHGFIFPGRHLTLLANTKPFFVCKAKVSWSKIYAKVTEETSRLA